MLPSTPYHLHLVLELICPKCSNSMRDKGPGLIECHVCGITWDVRRQEARIG